MRKYWAAAFAIHCSLLAQITILSTPAPTGPDPTNFGTLWPGGLISLVCRGLNVKKALIQPQKVPLRFEVAGIRVRVGLGQIKCGDFFVDNPPIVNVTIFSLTDAGGAAIPKTGLVFPIMVREGVTAPTVAINITGIIK